MSRAVGVGGILAVLVGVLVFARLNGGEVATVHLGFLTLRDVPITFVLFGGLVLGMLVMLLAGLHADLKVRRLLRQRMVEEERNRLEIRHAPTGASPAPGDRPVPERPAGGGPLEGAESAVQAEPERDPPESGEERA